METWQQQASILTVDVAAIRANYRFLRASLPHAACAAVLKADAYGLGAAPIAEALRDEGCHHFFVAHLEEGVALRAHLAPPAELFVLHGPVAGTETEFLRHALIPVLNSLEQISAWRRLALVEGRSLDAVIQLDTGMNRLGLAPAEVDRLLADPHALDGLTLRYLMSHLACAEDQRHPMNRAQLERFIQLRKRFPACRASFANSSGIFLGPDYHFDLARPGAALYGIAPVSGAPNPMRAVVRLQAGVLQVRDIGEGDRVGYGARYRASSTRRIATVAAGYADGWLRSLGGRGHAYVDGTPVPIAGTVSMDTCALDVTGLPPQRLFPGALVDLICEAQTVDQVAAQAGTIGYEILTSLRQRYRRIYLDQGGASAHLAAEAHMRQAAAQV